MSAKDTIKLPKDELELQEDSNTPLTLEELGKEFDKQFALACRLAETLSKNQLIRVFKKSLGYPLKNDEIALFHKDEELPYYKAAEVQQLKINMVLETIREAHEQEVNKMRDGIKEDVEGIVESD